MGAGCMVYNGTEAANSCTFLGLFQHKMINEMLKSRCKLVASCGEYVNGCIIEREADGNPSPLDIFLVPGNHQGDMISQHGHGQEKDTAYSYQRQAAALGTSQPSLFLLYRPLLRLLCRCCGPNECPGGKNARGKEKQYLSADHVSGPELLPGLFVFKA
eukprot:1141282-Pelagomonas_calceolata.AAC.2